MTSNVPTRTAVQVLLEQLDIDYAVATTYGKPPDGSCPYSRTVRVAQAMVYPPEAWDIVYDIVRTYLEELEKE